MVKTQAYIDQIDKTALIEQQTVLVKRIAYHLMARLPARVQVDDLIQAGLIGLLDAGKHYNSSLGAQFVTYATIRVRGAMLDEVRRSDWVPKSVHNCCSICCCLSLFSAAK